MDHNNKPTMTRQDYHGPRTWPWTSNSPHWLEACGVQNEITWTKQPWFNKCIIVLGPRASKRYHPNKPTNLTHYLYCCEPLSFCAPLLNSPQWLTAWATFCRVTFLPILAASVTASWLQKLYLGTWPFAASWQVGNNWQSSLLPFIIKGQYPRKGFADWPRLSSIETDQ